MFSLEKHQKCTFCGENGSQRGPRGGHGRDGDGPEGVPERVPRGVKMRVFLHLFLVLFGCVWVREEQQHKIPSK